VKKIINLVAFLPFLAFSQEIIKIKKVSGIYYLSNDISPKQAKELAVIEAKTEALRKAGIGETVNSSKVLISTENNNIVNQLFNNIATVELNGAITKYKVDTIFERRNEFSQTYFEAFITADVIKYKTKPDPSFQLQIDGVDKVYNQGSDLKFSCTPFIAGYLKIFQITSNYAGMIYPNEFENSTLFIKDQKVQFPIKKGLSYSLDDIESNTLVFVFTKSEIPFTVKQTIEGITEWIYKISPEQRQVQSFSIMVK
jgi:hypothetical protein